MATPTRSLRDRRLDLRARYRVARSNWKLVGLKRSNDARSGDSQVNAGLIGGAMLIAASAAVVRMPKAATRSDRGRSVRPVLFTNVDGWAEDDHDAASCRPQQLQSAAAQPGIVAVGQPMRTRLQYLRQDQRRRDQSARRHARVLRQLHAMRISPLGSLTAF